MPLELSLALLFFVIAFLYSSVGFGGGSSYLALLSLFFSNYYEIRSMALVLNVTVVSIGTAVYIKNRVFDWKSFWPFLLASIPLAYLGAQLRLSQRTFFIILGTLLLLSGFFLLAKYLRSPKKERTMNLVQRIGLGGIIGFFAGLSGIGGGIYLSPALNMLGWKDTRKVASLASFFILVNSMAGLLGLMMAGTFQLPFELLLALVVAVGLGGLLGSFLSNKKLRLNGIGILTAMLVIYVGLRILLLHLWGIYI
ncbi:MAG: TSUP family transporter [Bacteroidetes bacterium]|nr:TSUP family transporter [Bacteroidota bacterium]